MKIRPPIPIHQVSSHAADDLPDPTRRALLTLMAASTALAAAGCSGPPSEPILPYVRMPEGMLPGEPVFYATTVVRDGYAHGVLVETNMGRPTKVEGNPLHPASLGATDTFSQAAILQLWDPDRSRNIMRGSDASSWEALKETLAPRLATIRRGRGKGLCVLTGTTTSPTLLRQLQELAKIYPDMRWHRHDPLHDANAEEGARAMFGQPARAGYRMDKVKVLLTLDADVFATGPGSVRQARDFMQARRDGTARSRLYAVEATPGLAGALADHRVPLAPADIEALVWRLAQRVGVVAASAGVPTGSEPWEAALLGQLQAHGPNSLVVAGPALSPEAHALVWAINDKLGNIGQTVFATPVAEPLGLPELTRAMQAGSVDTLLILETNPVYDAPGSLAFTQALRKVPLSVHLGLYQDETGAIASWHVPRTHDFEDWSDALAWDGSASIVQPVIAPLYGGYSPHAFLTLLLVEEVSAYDLVRQTWQSRWNSPDAFERNWRESLQAGCVKQASVAPLAFHGFASAPPQPAQLPPDGLVAVFVADPAVGGGAYANNAWLQELPRSLTKLTWDNAALISVGTARSLAVQTGDVMAIEAQHGASIEAPVMIVPGHADGVVSLPLGYGRTAAGRVGNGVGFDAYPLQATDESGNTMTLLPVTMKRTGRTYAFARTQTEMAMHGRDIVRVVDLQDIDKPVPKPELPSLYPPVAYPDYAWGMSVDLDSCIGCNACTIACQAENNIPVVGKEEVSRGREMHWIRVDRYQDEAAGRTLFQPVPCMHCENAPCEEVCPVGATVHDSEGLNAQVYNRCVGTRFCSNNCPYKVRRFNFFKYSDDDEHAAAHQNPNVTVRQRGVMEKCTYCVQRISRARIEAQKENRPIRDGDVVTACEAACPTQAIVFGNVNDPASRVSQAKKMARDYALLEELNTRPRTTYLARVANPQASLEPGEE